MIRSKALLGLAVLLATCFISSPATADVLNGTIFLGNAALAGFPTPFATAVINRTDTTHATITYTGLTQTSGGNTYQYYFGGDDAIGFNINATNYSIAFAFGGTCSPFPPPGCGSLGNGSPWNGGGAGFGSDLNIGVNVFDGYTQTYSQIVLSVTNNTGTWATATDVRLLNDAGFWAGAHIFVCQQSVTNANCTNAEGGAAATGFAVGAVQGVPEPGTLALLGSGLLLLGTLGRRFKK